MKIKIDNVFIADIFLLVWCLELVYPPLTTIAPQAAIKMICCFLWFIFAFLSNKSFFLKKRNNPFFLSLFFYLCVGLIPYIFGNPIVAHRYLSMMMIPFGPIIYYFYKDVNRIDDLKFILFISLVFGIITYFTTLEQLSTNAFIVRSIKSSGEYSEALSTQGVGSYSFVYMIVPLAILFLYVVLKSKKKLVKIFSLLGYILALFFVIKANYMTALLTVLVSSFVLMISYIVYNKNKDLKKLIVDVVILCLIFGIMLNFNSIIELIKPMLPIRVAEVIANTGESGIFNSIWLEFIDDRLPTIMYSFNTFFNYPLLGAIASGAVGISNGFLTNVGQHSYIADTFAFYGIFVGIISLFVVFLPLKMQKKRHGNKALRISIVFCVLGIYLLNNATESVALVIGIVYPFIDEYII